MNLTSGQRTTVKTFLSNNPTLGDQEAADALNALASPNYWVWKKSISRSEVYATVSDIPSSWVWATYKAQSVTEQGAWTQMFMGDRFDPSALNNRVGVDDIFGGSAPGNAQRSHIFAVSRRKATVLEKLFTSAAPTQSGKTTGNDGVSGNRGNTTNPDLLGADADGVTIEGLIGSALVAEIRAS